VKRGETRQTDARHSPVAATNTATYLLPIADREPLIWILRERRTAFPIYRRREAEQLTRGDLLLLYTTRGCFHNPTRDRGRVIGVASVKRPPSELTEPIRFGEREFPIGVDLVFEALAPRGEGVELAPIVSDLPRTFPNPVAWSASVRRALVPFDLGEAQQIVEQLGDRPATRQVIETYAMPAGAERTPNVDDRT
jgi:hypothetical protein